MTNKEFMERVYRKVYGHEIDETITTSFAKQLQKVHQELDLVGSTLCSPKERERRLDKCWNDLFNLIESGRKWNNLMEKESGDHFSATNEGSAEFFTPEELL